MTQFLPPYFLKHNLLVKDIIIIKQLSVQTNQSFRSPLISFAKLVFLISNLPCCQILKFVMIPIFVLTVEFSEQVVLFFETCYYLTIKGNCWPHYRMWPSVLVSSLNNFKIWFRWASASKDWCRHVGWLCLLMNWKVLAALIKVQVGNENENWFILHHSRGTAPEMIKNERKIKISKASLVYDIGLSFIVYAFTTHQVDVSI